MKTDVEKLDPTRVRLSVEVPFEELKANLDTAYRQIGRQVRVPGFRPGKVPQRVIDARVGRAAVLEQAVNDALPGLYGAAVEETGIAVLGQPEVDVTQIDDGTSLTFTAEVDVRPEFELPARDAVEVTVPSVSVEESDVDGQLDTLRERFATAITVERPAADGDLVTLDLRAVTPDDEPLEGGEVLGQSYKVGSGTMLDGLDDAVLGKTAGESASFTTTLVGGAAGQEATVTVAVTEVKEQQLPDLDDDFAQLASQFDTVEELRADTRANLELARRREQLVAARDAVLETYLDGIDVPVPARLLAHELEHRSGDLARELEAYGLTKEQYVTTMGTTVEEFDADSEQRATTGIKAQFVLDALAAQEEIKPDQGALSQLIVNRAARARVSPDQYAQQIVQAGQVDSLISELVRSRALALLVRDATIKDSEGNTLDVEALEAELGAPRTGAGMTVPADEDTGQVEVVEDGFGVPDDGDDDDGDGDDDSTGTDAAAGDVPGTDAAGTDAAGTDATGTDATGEQPTAGADDGLGAEAGAEDLTAATVDEPAEQEQAGDEAR